MTDRNTICRKLLSDEYRSLRIGIVILAVTLIVTRVLLIERLFIDKEIADHLIGRWVNNSFLVLGYLLLIFGAARHRNWKDFGIVCGTGILGLLLVQVVKWATRDQFPRPSTGGGGFPSGHAQASFMLAYMVGCRYPRLAIPAYLVAAVITSSRVPYMHFYYQIVVGGMLGLVLPVLFEQLVGRKPRRRIQSSRTSPQPSPDSP